MAAPHPLTGKKHWRIWRVRVRLGARVTGELDERRRGRLWRGLAVLACTIAAVAGG